MRSLWPTVAILFLALALIAYAIGNYRDHQRRDLPVAHRSKPAVNATAGVNH